jgi:glutathione peroxidase
MRLAHVAVACVLCGLGLAAVRSSQVSREDTPAEDWKTRSLYTLETRTLEGEPVKLEAYKGKVTLVVNVASRCGYTPQYEGLENLYKEFKDRGLVVLGFPCNDFGNQEPGTPGEIREFCTSNYQVTFPLMEKVTVKPGEKQSVVYAALQAKTGQLPRWNFGKYLVSRDGVRATFFDSKVAPEDKELREALDRALASK